MTTTIDAAPVHAEACNGLCGLWIAAGTPGCQPYPCRCQQTRDGAPLWVIKQGQARCYWQKRGQEDTPGGGYRSRCPCWGGNREGKPGDCCAHHSANPFYAAVVVTGSADPDVPAVEVPEPLDVDMPPTLDDEPDESAFDWPDEIREPFIRRWPVEELHCDCATPFDNDKRSVAFHCTSCHENWANVQTSAVHRRRWTEPCRDPRRVRDCVTGRPLLYADADGIWRDSHPGAGDGVPTAAMAA